MNTVKTITERRFAIMAGLLVIILFLLAYFPYFELAFPTSEMYGSEFNINLSFLNDYLDFEFLKEPLIIYTAGFLGLYYVLIFFAARHFSRRYAPSADPVIFPVVMLLCGTGFAVLYRVSFHIAYLTDKPLKALMPIKQIGFSVVGLFLFVCVIGLLDDRRITALSRKKYVYVIAAVLLICITAVVGKEINGRKLWLTVGYFDIQTVEFIKLLLVLFIAGYFNDEGRYIRYRKIAGINIPGIKYTGPFFLMFILSIVPVFLQRDLGPTVLLTLVFLIMFYIGSGSMFYPASGIILMIAGGVSAYLFNYPTIVKTRFDMWLDPFGRNAGMAGSLWAIAEGRLWGNGLGYGFSHFIPVVQSDFNFSAICEELGFLGGASIILLYLVFVWRGFQAAQRTESTYKKLVASGISTIFAVQTLIIVSGDTGIIPMTGITLPFVSYGGSSMLVNFIMAGMLIKISEDDGLQ